METATIELRLERLENAHKQLQEKLLQIEGSIASKVMRILRDYWSIIDRAFTNVAMPDQKNAPI